MSISRTVWLAAKPSPVGNGPLRWALVQYCRRHHTLAFTLPELQQMIFNRGWRYSHDAVWQAVLAEVQARGLAMQWVDGQWYVAAVEDSSPLRLLYPPERIEVELKSDAPRAQL